MFFKVLLLILLFHSLIAENSDENVDGSGADLTFPQRCESSDDCTSMFICFFDFNIF